MSPARLTFQNWIVALGRDPSVRYHDEPIISAVQDSGETGSGIREAVQQAIESLTEQEKFFIIRFYFMGQGYAEMSELSGRAGHRLVAIHRRALTKLRTRLSDFVRRRFRIEPAIGKKCPICQSSSRCEIDALIAHRDRTRTWRPVIDVLKNRYSLKIKSPQMLISHEKYH